MSEKNIDTLFKLFEEYKVEIPIVQRDYAQGRNDDHARMVRHNLLKDIKLAILGITSPLDMNFIYGKAENNKFIPLDGQQRLTTLFLLYLYAFYNDDAKNYLFEKFTYETRTSSREFLKKLIENRTSVFTSNMSPSKEIEDSEWFVSSWKFDPTILSVLTMVDDIKAVFCDVNNLAQRLSIQDFNPVIFNFLEMKDLGMEDSLYVKLNARGKPLTPLENFKARLVGRLKDLQIDFAEKFEHSFDCEWTDMFWARSKENFDKTYLMFFGVLLMNQEICSNDTNWSNTLDYEKIDIEIFKTVFFTFNFLINNCDYKSIAQIIFNALTDKRTYYDRLLFHGVTTYLYMAKGVDDGSLQQWIRILKNLILNSQIDTTILYRRAIDGINKLSDKYNKLIDYFSKEGNVTGFSLDQIEEERIKAQLILRSKDFELAINQAEQHPYFKGQIRSALYLSMDKEGKYNLKYFEQYWNKIDSLFDETKPKHGHLLRQALLTLGDYTLPVSSYKTLCVDDPNEAVSTPSMKRLFSNHGSIVKQLLDTLNQNDNIESQLKIMVNNSSVTKFDWRYCFKKFPNLFTWMSNKHLRIREVKGELIVIPNKSSSGYNYEIFSLALHHVLKQKGVKSTFEGDIGTWADRYLCVNGFHIRFKERKFIVKDKTGAFSFESQKDDQIVEVLNYFVKISER